MATYFVSSSGSNTSPYDTWAKAATSLQTALTAATTSGDIVVIQYNGVPSGDAELSVDTTYTFSNGVSLIAASADDASAAYTPTAMGTSNWIGNSTTNRSVTLLSGATATSLFIYGITWRTAGSGDSIVLSANSGSSFIQHEGCYFWQGASGSGDRIRLCNQTSSGVRVGHRFKDCTFRFANTSQRLVCAGYSEFYNCTVSSAGSAPSTFIEDLGNPSGCALSVWYGCDLSHITGNILAASGVLSVHLIQCKLGTGVSLLTASTTGYNYGEVTAFDCSSGDDHYSLWNSTGRGDCAVVTGIYANDGAEWNESGSKASWKIVTTSGASFFDPYKSPLIPVHHEGTSAITPYLEILRDGSSAAFTDKEVWSEWYFKGTTGTTKSSYDQTDRAAITASAANQTASSLGAGDWTGENATAWFGKLSPASSITPAEIGDLTARICVGAASTTVYVDPQIRGLS